MSRFPVAVPRGPRQPRVSSGGDSIHVVSDVHFEVPQVTYLQHQQVIAGADMDTMVGRSTVLAWGHDGDETTYATTAELDAFAAWWGARDHGGLPSLLTPGNHDLRGHPHVVGLPDILTPAQWATLRAPLGVPASSYVVDVGTNLRVLCVAPCDDISTGSAYTYRLTLDAASLAWVDARLGETTRACVILHHAPLYGSINASGDPTYLSSNGPDWRVHENAGALIGDVIAAHPNLRAWISGHIHSPVTTPEVVTPMTYGAVTIAAVSASSPHPIPATATPAIVSVHVTVLPDRVEVRYRDHGAGQWLAPVHTVTL